ncbi:DUF1285 domain-containing protein [Salaquimonas pukyongi]|uniref:DUF1285 domain-containing protein n=1 Tax=Salaquimonas pukyongi TaxID=2712698 RepID=UPI00096B8AC4|nr:DUF1285 domain-containing protein [Salaquimonas pukyongi]
MAESGKAASSGATDPVSGNDKLSGLKALVERAGTRKRGPAPVEKWDPDFSGDLDLEIRADGTWLYMGTPIARKALVELFATVLRKDEDGFTYLVTPVERYKIGVEDAPFLAVEMDASEGEAGPVLTFRTNVGDVVEAGPQNPLRFQNAPENDGVKPYLLVRGRLEALLTRPVMYELVTKGEEVELEGKTVFAVRSNGAVFPIMAATELHRLASGGEDA